MFTGRFLSPLSALPTWLITALCLFTAIVVGWFDYITGDYSVILFYLIPIYVATQFLGSRTCKSIAMLSSAELLYVNAVVHGTGFSLVSLRTWNAVMEAAVIILAGHLLHKLKEESALLETLAKTDHLTGALNRRSFHELAAYELNNSRRYGRTFTTAYLDVDNFKSINDRFGHETGDMVLKIVANAIQGTIRRSDVFARLGGDEFMIMFPETGVESLHVLDKVSSLIESEFDKHPWSATFSIGAITFGTPPDSVDEMIQLTDHQMYSAKQGGKNRVHHAVFHPEGMATEVGQAEGHSTS